LDNENPIDTDQISSGSIITNPSSLLNASIHEVIGSIAIEFLRVGELRTRY
jgi:hypothetical protein